VAVNVSSALAQALDRGTLTHPKNNVKCEQFWTDGKDRKCYFYLIFVRTGVVGKNLLSDATRFLQFRAKNQKPNLAHPPIREQEEL
jgi:hypothetical protein